MRALASRAEASPQGTLDIVEDLADGGIVTLRRAGRSRMVALNREHLAYAALADLISLRSRLVDALRDRLGGWRSLDAAWLYGSAARDDGTSDSDIDVLLVGSVDDEERWLGRVDLLREDITRWTGNASDVHSYRRDEFQRLVRERNPIIEALRTDGIVLSTPRAGAARLLAGATS